MSALTCDIVVVGAGPAGAAAAITAARQGRDVVMVDKARFPRDKCCGDGLTTLAVRQLARLGFDRSSVTDWMEIGSATLRSPSGRSVRLPLPTGRGTFAAVAPRRQLDQALVELAVRQGVRVLEGAAFTGFAEGYGAGSSATASSITVCLADAGPVTARYVIAADGMWSPVRRAVGATEPGYLGEWHALRQYASNVTGPAASELFVWFEPDLLPGYAWSFPLPHGRANVGFGVLRDGTRRVQQMAGIWEDLWNRAHVRAALGDGFEREGRHLAWPIPARIDRSVTGIGRVLLAGDAIGAPDPLTGEGIGQALLTGIEAARAVDRAGAFDPNRARADYARAVHHHLLADHHTSEWLSRMVARPKGARGGVRALSLVGQRGRRLFARYMFEDEPRAIFTSPSRWHTAMFRGDGEPLAGGVLPAETAELPSGV